MPRCPTDDTHEPAASPCDAAEVWAQAPSIDSTDQYLAQIRGMKILTVDEERDLARRAQQGEDVARNQLVLHNLRFAVRVARQYASHGVPLKDLIQEANIGLIRASYRYDPEYRNKFISYAMWYIHQAVRDSLALSKHPVRLPSARGTQLSKINRVAGDLRDRHGRAPSVRQIAEAADIPAPTVRALLRVSRGRESLSAGTSETEGRAPLIERITGGRDVALDMERRARALAIDQAMDAVSPREREIVRLHYGLDHRRPHTLAEIGIVFGITRERVRQLRERAFERIRASPYADGLSELVHDDLDGQ